jgi:hypothetical protein
LICLLGPSLPRAVESELDYSPSAELHPQVGFHNVSLRHLMMLLHAETSEGGGLEHL